MNAPQTMAEGTSSKLAWLARMAWRDSRKNRGRLFLFIAAIVFGIAALVAIYSFSRNIRKDVDKQAAALIGADLMVTSNKPVTDTAAKNLLARLGDDRSSERSFVSMVYFPKTGGTRLVQVRALEGAFPYYGELETTPASAGRTFRQGQTALVDQTLMLQFGAALTDTIRVGNLAFPIKGSLLRAPGQASISSEIAPVVYIPARYLRQTGLVQKGSRIAYTYFYKFKRPETVEDLVKKLDPKFDSAGLNYDTIESRKESTGRSFEQLTKFLAMVGFIALLLGCVGVASAIHIYIREKIASIAIMRCLGVKAADAFRIYLLQIMAIGFLGSVVGALAGSLVQFLLPLVFQEFLPVTVSTGLSWTAMAQGILTGMVISVLFALLPLIAVRNISPLNTLRMSYEHINLLGDPLRWLVYALIGVFVVVFSYFQLGNWLGSVAFSIFMLLAFLVLAGVAKLLMLLSRLLIRNSWSYLWRQGFANLYRPNNQTLTLIVSIGLSSTFICTLTFMRQMLVRQVNIAAEANSANMILFDIQPKQKTPLAALTRRQKLPVIQQVPILTVRVTELNGKTEAQARKDTLNRASRRVFGEFRVTYRDSLSPTEKIKTGEWIGKAKPGEEVPISVEDRVMYRSRLKLGDHVTFDVQGVPVKAVIASTRTVNWNKMQTNFRILFPTGVLEDAPQSFAMTTRVPSKQVSASYQQAVVSRYPNISMIDLGQILSVLEELMSKLGAIISFMSAFSIITGIVVLIASVRISKYQRIRESVLLRTIGASRRQILWITALEYIFLGALSSLTGTLIAFGASWALARFNFDIPFHADWTPATVLFLAITALTTVIGLLNSRGIVNRPPLEILRNDL